MDVGDRGGYQVAQGIGGIIATQTFLVGVRFENVGRITRVALERPPGGSTGRKLTRLEHEAGADEVFHLVARTAGAQTVGDVLVGFEHGSGEVAIKIEIEVWM